MVGRPERKQPRARAAAFAAIAGLIVLAAGLRLVGIGYLLPEVMNRDGMVLLRQVEILRGGPATAESHPWHYSFYPHVVARVAALLPEVDARADGPTDLARHLELASAPWIRLREVSVWFSLLAIPATYLLARRFLDRGGALFAAALVATSLHHIVLSIQEKPHAAATSLIAIALLAAMRLRRSPDVLAYILCGVASGLAIGALQSAAACLFAVGAAFLLRRRDRPRASGWYLAATILIVAASIRFFYPFFFGGERADSAPAPGGETRDLETFVSILSKDAGGARVPRILRAVWGLDPLLASLAAIGIVIWLAEVLRDPARRRSRLGGDLAVLLALVVPYLLALLSFRETLVRFTLPFLPLLACAAGFAFQRLRWRWLAATLLAIPLVAAVHFARMRTRPSPLAEAASWVEANVPAGEPVVVVPHYDLPLLLTQDAIAWNARHPGQTIWSEYLASAPEGSLVGPRRKILVEPGDRPGSRFRLLDDPVDYLEASGARTLVVELSSWHSGFLRDRLELVERISPAIEDDGRGRGMVLWGTGYDPLRPSWSGILRHRSLGVAVEIYRLR